MSQQIEFLKNIINKYKDVKPYYDAIDKLIGIFGTNEGLENDPDGIFLPPPKPRLHELFIKKG